jgi:hypothetical protein
MRVLSRSALTLVATAALSGLTYANEGRPGINDVSPPITGGNPAEALFSENFDVVLPPGWTMVNDSPGGPGSTTWFQGNPTVFPSHSGSTSSYAGANFNASTGSNACSAWLISPVMPFTAGEVVSFWTRTVANPAVFPDRLHLKFSPAGGGLPANFTQTLLTVNPTLEPNDTGYPAVWTQFVANITTTTAAGRLAFHYDVPNGGPLGLNANYIGVDTLSVTPEPASLGAVALAGFGMLRRRRR